MSRMSWPGPRCGALLLAMLAALAVSGCGSDTSRTEGTKIALDVAKGLKAKLFSSRKSPAAKPEVDAEALAAIAMDSFPGPLIMARIDKLGTVSAMGEFGRNGATRTFATPQRQTLVFRNGLLVGTRGLGHDLMSADFGPAAELVSRRQAGTYRRTYRFLDGEGIERPVPMACELTPGEPRSFSFAGTRYATLQLAERCESSGLAIVNDYWVTQGGTIAMSRQWIGAALGYVTITLVRENRL
ncbi:MAG: YjbF family lipoprotein [Rhodobacteraceae bacterium]|nr:YjbF family lipoprotein [Paracoccaceae bacterium]